MACVVYARRQATRSQAPCWNRLQRLRAAGDEVPGAASPPRAVGAAPDDVLVGHIRRVSKPRTVMAKGTGKPGRTLLSWLSEGRNRPSPISVLTSGQAHGPKAHDGTITTEAPAVMWGTGMTTTLTV